MDIDFIERLERQLNQELPGKNAQIKMASHGRNYDKVGDLPYKDACVLILLYPIEKEWHIAFIKRSRLVSDPHSGQISLPGGRVDETDTTYKDCALREAQEEIGVNAGSVAIIGELTPLNVEVSRYRIFPFVGFAAIRPTFEIQQSEVSHILEVPLLTFLNDEFRKKGDIDVGRTTLKDVPYYDIEGEVLWGATAMIMSEFSSVVQRAKNNNG